METKNIKGLLPRGAIRQTANELGISATTVSKVVSQNFNSTKRNEILNSLVKQIVKHQNETHEAEQAMEKVLSNQTPTA